MKPTQRQIEREAKRLSNLSFRTWQEVARHVLRRIAAAERRGFNLGKDATEAKYDDIFESRTTTRKCKRRMVK